MWTNLVAAGFVAIMASEAPPPVDPSEAAAAGAVAKYYPAEAKAAGIQGQVVLRCDHTIHAALKACALISEDPVGYGFGEAALALSKLSVGNPKVTIDPAKIHLWDREQIVFRFRTNPISITPNPVVPVAVIINPDWIRRPSGAELAEAAAVATPGMKGVAVINCVVATSEKLEDCRVVAEEPPGHGFGAAALNASRYMRMRPQLRDGAPVGGAHVEIPLHFGPAG